jgi:hypothetical protein
LKLGIKESTPFLTQAKGQRSDLRYEECVGTVNNSLKKKEYDTLGLE